MMLSKNRTVPEFLEAELEGIRGEGLWREFRRVESASGPTIRVEGREFLNLASNNYLGLANHPALIQAAIEAIERYGTGAGASRYLSGNHELYQRLEEAVARWKGAEACLVFSSGYAANLGIIGALVGPGDLVILDKLVHASLIDGARLSGATVRVYPHLGLEKLQRLLSSVSSTKRTLIVTDGVFSMDGDLAPLPKLVALAKQYDALLLVDDAHATGVLGERGAGSLEHWKIEGEECVIQMGTFSKALGSLGGFVAGSRLLIDLIRNRARSLIYSTALPAGVLAASLAAVTLVQQAHELRQRLHALAGRWRDGLQQLGFDTMQSQSPIVPILIGSTENALAVAKQLEGEGVYAPAIRPPTVAPGKCRIRTSLMATHTEAQLDQALGVFASLREVTARECLLRDACRPQRGRLRSSRDKFSSTSCTAAEGRRSRLASPLAAARPVGDISRAVTEIT